MERRLRAILMRALLAERGPRPATQWSDLEVIEEIAERAVADDQRLVEDIAADLIGAESSLYSSPDGPAVYPEIVTEADLVAKVAGDRNPHLRDEWAARRMRGCPACALVMRHFVREALAHGPHAAGR